jgi:hypothetical protein
MHVGSGRIPCSCNSRKRESVSPSARHFDSRPIRFDSNCFTESFRRFFSSLLFSSLLSCAAIPTGVAAPQQSAHIAVRPSHPTQCHQSTLHHRISAHELDHTRTPFHSSRSSRPIHPFPYHPIHPSSAVPVPTTCHLDLYSTCLSLLRSGCARRSIRFFSCCGCLVSSYPPTGWYLSLVPLSITDSLSLHITKCEHLIHFRLIHLPYTSLSVPKLPPYSTANQA